MASASLTARFVRRSSRSLTSPKVACAHCSGDITASQFSIPLSSLLLRFLLLPRFYHFFTRTLRVRVRCLSWWQRDPVGTAWSTKVAPQPGQAQGPLIHSTPPLVPTGPWAASTPTRTSTRPPHPLHPTPCPYRTLGRKHLNG